MPPSRSTSALGNASSKALVSTVRKRLAALSKAVSMPGANPSCKALKFNGWRPYSRRPDGQQAGAGPDVLTHQSQFVRVSICSDAVSMRSLIWGRLGMRMRGSRATLVLGALLCINLWSIGSARADCQPAVQTPGTVVTCTGSVPTGFAATANLLTINILAGAVINDNGTTGLDLGQRNTINNFGSIITGNTTTGILSNGNLNVVNNFGSIIAGDDSTLVTFVSRNTLTNNGTMTVGAGSSLLISGDSNNAIVNAGTMTTKIGRASCRERV